MQINLINIAKKYVPFKKQPKRYDERRNEIIELNQILGDFGIAYSNLVEQSPKTTDESKCLLEICQSMANNEQLLSLLFMEMKLPIQKLVTAHAGVSLRTLEEHSDYILAMALILSGPYPYLREYFSCAI